MVFNESCQSANTNTWRPTDIQMFVTCEFAFRIWLWKSKWGKFINASSAFPLLPAAHYLIYSFTSMNKQLTEKGLENAPSTSIPSSDRRDTVAQATSPIAPRGSFLNACQLSRSHVRLLYSDIHKAQYTWSFVDTCNPRLHDHGRSYRRICTSCPGSF